VIEFFIWSAIGCVAIAILFTVLSAQSGAKKKAALASIPDFTAAVSFGGAYFGPGIALDPESNQFAIAKRGKPPEVYAFNQLIAVEALKNGGSIQKTNRGSQVAGAAVGGLLLGPVGLLLGGVTGSKWVEQKITRLSLKIFTDDLVSPVTEILFFDSPSGSQPGSFAVSVAARQLDEWHGRFQTILHKQAGQQLSALRAASVQDDGTATLQIN
jgi:hypothetical protein